MATLNFNSGNNYIIPSENNMTYRGQQGNDVYIISKATEDNATIKIIDTEGANVIQLVDGLIITTSLFTKNAARLSLSDGTEITINGADKFTYETSGNATSGDIGSQWTYSDFVKGMGITGGPPSSGSENGTANITINDSFELPVAKSWTDVDINISEDTPLGNTVTITATDIGENFLYEVDGNGVSREGVYNVVIDGFDAFYDKLTIVMVNTTTALTTQEFDALPGVEVTSDNLGGTQIYFAYNENGQAGSLQLPDITDRFEDTWIATDYTVEIITKNLSYNIINIDVSSDSTISATSAAEDFRYEVGTDGVSKEGPYSVTIDGFDKSNDKLTLVLVDATSNLTTQEFDAIQNVDITSDGISGTQIFFSPDLNNESGRLVLPNIEESFSDTWTATTYTVEIIADVNLV